jgi:hypothetical protein
MMALFGAPYLDQIVATYDEVAPLASGWQARVPLHQLHPLLVHVCLFGAAYRESALAAARAALRISGLPHLPHVRCGAKTNKCGLIDHQISSKVLYVSGDWHGDRHGPHSAA